MFYHVIVETSEKVGKQGVNREYFELDKLDLKDVLERIVNGCIVTGGRSGRPTQDLTLTRRISMGL